MNDICKNRHNGNNESDNAFDGIKQTLTQKRAEVFLAIFFEGQDGLTAQEYADIQGVGINTISGRFSELKRDGLIRKIGTRNKGGVCVVV